MTAVSLGNENQLERDVSTLDLQLRQPVTSHYKNKLFYTNVKQERNKWKNVIIVIHHVKKEETK